MLRVQLYQKSIFKFIFVVDFQKYVKDKTQKVTNIFYFSLLHVDS